MTSAAFDPVWPDDAVEVGRIVDAWGLRGWLKVQPYTPDPQALFSSRRWFLKAPTALSRPAPTALSQAPSASQQPTFLRIRQAREHGDAVVAHADGIDDRDAAERLRGARVFVSRASFPTPGADEFYWVDLIGAEVVNRAGDVLGVVVGLLDTGAQSVLRIASRDAAESGESGGREVLIPFVEAYVDEVDLAARQVHVDWGLDF